MQNGPSGAAGYLGTNGGAVALSVQNVTQRPRILIYAGAAPSANLFVGVRWRTAKIVSSTGTAFTVGSIPETAADYKNTRTGRVS